MYNVRSFNKEEKLEALLEELKNVHWDITVITETWREFKDEMWKTEAAHTFCGMGGTKGRRGIAFLVHRRWFVTAMRGNKYQRRLTMDFTTTKPNQDCKGWGQNAKLGPHSAIWGKLGTALQAYALNPCTKFPPNPTSRKVNT